MTLGRRPGLAFHTPVRAARCTYSHTATHVFSYVPIHHTRCLPSLTLVRQSSLYSTRLSYSHTRACAVCPTLQYVGHPPPEHSAITVDLIYPATDKHVAKHRAQKRIMVGRYLWPGLGPGESCCTPFGFSSCHAEPSTRHAANRVQLLGFGLAGVLIHRTHTVPILTAREFLLALACQWQYHLMLCCAPLPAGCYGARTGLCAVADQFAWLCPALNEPYYRTLLVDMQGASHGAGPCPAAYPDNCSTHVSSTETQITETPEMYERTVLPYIRAIPPARLQWVYNVLERKVGSAHPQHIAVSNPRKTLLALKHTLHEAALWHYTTLSVAWEPAHLFAHMQVGRFSAFLSDMSDFALSRHLQKEVERLIFEDSDPQLGFMLHPDLKWVSPHRSPHRHALSVNLVAINPPRMANLRWHPATVPFGLPLERRCGAATSTLSHRGHTRMPIHRWCSSFTGDRAVRRVVHPAVHRTSRLWTSCTAWRWCTGATCPACGRWTRRRCRCWRTCGTRGAR